MCELTNIGNEDLPLARTIMLDMPAPENAMWRGVATARRCVFGNHFLGVEHPLAENGVAQGRLRCSLPCLLPLRTGAKGSWCPW